MVTQTCLCLSALHINLWDVICWLHITVPYTCTVYPLVTCQPYTCLSPVYMLAYKCLSPGYMVNLYMFICCFDVKPGNFVPWLHVTSHIYVYSLMFTHSCFSFLFTFQFFTGTFTDIVNKFSVEELKSRLNHFFSKVGHVLYSLLSCCDSLPLPLFLCCLSFLLTI